MKTEKKNTLLQYLHCLKKEELNRFRKFLSDTNFQLKTKNDKRGRLIKLFELIEKYALKKSIYNLAIQTKIYNELYADLDEQIEVMDTKRRNKLAANMTELTKLVEQFLMYEALEEDEESQIKLLGKKILDKNQLDLWTRFERKFRNKLDTEEVVDLSLIEKKMQLEMLKLRFFESTGALIQKDNLETLTLLTDQYWLFKKFEFHNTIQSLVNINPIKDFSNIAPLDAYFTLSTFYKQSKTAPVELVQRLHLNDTSLRLSKHPSEKLYNELIELLVNNRNTLSNNDISNFFYQLINFCIGKIRGGDSTYSNKLLDNYKIMEAWGILTKDNLQPNALLNIVKLSCDNRDFVWAKTIIDKYASFISPLEQDLLYCAFYFYKGNGASNKVAQKENYTKAYDYIETLEKKKIPFRWHYKILKVKLLYETDEQYNPYTIPNFENTSKAIQRIKDLSDTHKKFSTNFIKILILIYSYKHQLKDISLEQISAKMEKMKADNKGISNEQWLLEKLTELTVKGK